MFGYRFLKIVFESAISILFFTLSPLLAKGFVFEEQVIEGKIRRPQMVLIKADQRPEFEPIIMKSLGKQLDAREFFHDSEVNLVPYNNGFRFRQGRIDYRED